MSADLRAVGTEPMTTDEAERITIRIGLKLDTIADNYQAVMPLIREAIEREAHQALGYRSPGDYVSDKFGDTLSRLGVEVRREVVRELTAAGMSTRAIAPVVGVSNKTVYEDSQVLPRVTPEPVAKVTETSKTETYVNTDTGEIIGPPAKVIGIDGKAYTRPTPKPINPEAVLIGLRTEAPDLAEQVDAGVPLLDAITELDDRKASIRANNMIFGQIIPQLYGTVHDPEAFLATYDPADNPNAESAHMLFTPEALHRMADQLHKLAALMEEMA